MLPTFPSANRAGAAPRRHHRNHPQLRLQRPIKPHAPPRPPWPWQRNALWEGNVHIWLCGIGVARAITSQLEKDASHKQSSSLMADRHCRHPAWRGQHLTQDYAPRRCAPLPTHIVELERPNWPPLSLSPPQRFAPNARNAGAPPKEPSPSTLSARRQMPTVTILLAALSRVAPKHWPPNV